MEKLKFMVQVTAEPTENGRMDVSIGIPEDSDNMTSEELMYILCSAIGLCIKASHNAGVAKDYESVKKVIDYIQEEFSSLTDFDDAVQISDKKFKK